MCVEPKLLVTLFQLFVDGVGRTVFYKLAKELVFNWGDVPEYECVEGDVVVVPDPVGFRVGGDIWLLEVPAEPGAESLPFCQKGQPFVPFAPVGLVQAKS